VGVGGSVGLGQVDGAVEDEHLAVVHGLQDLDALERWLLVQVGAGEPVLDDPIIWRI
jgi:hypothetical protein